MIILNIELPDEAVRIAEEGARRANMSLADWIGLRIAGRRGVRAEGDFDDKGYPLGWCERTCGSLEDMEDFCEPADPPPTPIAPMIL